MSCIKTIDMILDITEYKSCGQKYIDVISGIDNDKKIYEWYSSLADYWKIRLST